MSEYLDKILKSLMSGDISVLNPHNISQVSNETIRLIEKPELTEYDVMCANLIIMISQIVYNNTDRNILFLDDGVYDLLLEKYKKYDSKFQVGAPVISFDQNGELITNNEVIRPISYLENAEDFKQKSLYFHDLTRTPPISSRYIQTIDRNSGRIISKKNVNVPHMYPKLVGSLDKCKFTLNREAMDKGVFDEPNVAIFERDFLAKHLQMGLIDMNTPFELIAELKYDGISVEADVTDRILSARSRGDANNDIAADLTPVLGGHKFYFAPEIPMEEAFGIKFEAIMTYLDLSRMSELKGKSYKNSRNGIIGLFGSSDAYDYRDLITLVPLATSMEGIDRVTEIEFLNKYYNSGEYLRYSILRGTYTEILFQVYKFVKEAEAMRPMLPFMYDGVVISYRDPKIINALGRENSINKYSIAIKFNPLVREAIFTGYSYTIGQDGRVTPMIHYTPVEFNGTIHTKSSGHSYGRFMELGLAVGDVINVEYTNDVMPYVTKPDIQNSINHNTPEAFPLECPCCGTRLIVNESGKSAFCPNVDCYERIIGRISNMMSKLNLKDFGEETFRFLGTKSLSQLLNYSYNDVKGIGEVNAQKLLSRIEELKTTPIFDYKILGAVGFTGMASETWKKILKVLTIQDIAYMSNEDLYCALSTIKGIGPKTVNIILEERHMFIQDLYAILNLKNIVSSKDFKYSCVIRFTGCRPDNELSMYLANKGCDARGDAGVTKSTDILVVPYIGFTSSKLNKVGPNTKIVDMAAFKANPDLYIM